MRTLDRVTCEYPLPDPQDQDREFVTGDFGGFGSDRFVITRDGRLFRQAPVRPREHAPVRDVEWPIDGDIRIFEEEERVVEAPAEYAVRLGRLRPGCPTPAHQPPTARTSRPH